MTDTTPISISADELVNAFSVSSIIYRSSDAKILYANAKTWQLFGCASEEEFMTFCQGNFIHLLAPQDQTAIQTLFEQTKTQQLQKEHKVSYHIRTKGGSEPEVEDRGGVSFLSDGTEVVSCTLTVNEENVSITERMDRLTGLLTREQFYVYADELIRRAKNDGTVEQYYILYTNIRHFKYYNLKYGTDEGDKLLQSWSDNLKNSNDGSLHARFGGDHFIMLSNRPHYKDVLNQIHNYFEAAYGQFGIKMKMGVYELKNTSVSINEACDLAKFACDSIKDENTFLCCYDQQIEKRLEVEAYVLQNIDRVLKERGIEVYYQPIIRTINGSLCGMEALARWVDTGHRSLFPNEFIPALENNQMITKLDLYVLDEVCRTIREKQDTGYINVPVSINLSRMDFLSCDIVDEVEKAVAKYGVARDMLCIEITESMVMGDRSVFERDIKRFRDAGYQVWMDDFGSGYSSLNVLRDFEIDEIKLDMLFLRTFNDKTKQLIRSIISMAKELNIRTLAEGVETQEQFDFLREIGCEKVQGYLFSPPIAPNQFRDMYTGRETQIETRLWRKYYSKIGEVNFITDKPLAIVDYDGTNFNYLYTNKSYKQVWHDVGIFDVKSVESVVNAKASPLWKLYRNLVSKLTVGGGFEQAEHIVNNQYVRFRAELLYEEQGHKLLNAELTLLTHEADQNHTDEMDNIFRMMYAMYDAVHTFDLDKDEASCVLDGTNDYHFDLHNQSRLERLKGIHHMAERFIHAEDRPAFLEFMNFDNMVERISKEEKSYITEIFRTRTANNGFIWKLHTIQLIPGTKKIIYSSRYVPHMYEQFSQKLENSVSENARSLVWKTLLNSQNINLFWKDTNHRFVGVNTRFLETFGIDSQSEIVGRTDADMMWQTQDDSFLEEENQVLTKGIAVHNHLGKYIIKGEVHDVLISKEPIYDNGQIVGLVGSLTIMDKVTSPNDRRLKDEMLDPVTGLMSAQGVAAMATEYAEAWEYRNEKFAIVTMVFESYKRAEMTYGSTVTRQILKEIGKVISRDEVGNMSIGRVYGASFVFFVKYKNRNDVQKIADSIKQQCRAIHRLSQYDVTLDPVVKLYFSEDSDDVHEMINLASGGYHVDYYLRKQNEQKRSSEILSRVPAAIAVFSISETHEISRVYLSEQAKKYAHIAESGESNLNELVSIVYKDDRSYVYNTAHQCAVEKKMADMEFRCIGNDGKMYWQRLILMPYMQPDGSYLLYGVYSDITDLKQRTEELRVQSQTDGLTGLKNRHALHEDFDRHSLGSVTMVMMDIDRFKQFNDNFGHDLGDRVIAECGHKIKEYFSDCDCYRYGGDEFLVISDVLDKKAIQQRINNMTDAIRGIHLDDGVPSIEISYGILNQTFSTLEELHEIFRKADDLLYEKKNRRKQASAMVQKQNEFLMNNIPGGVHKCDIGKNPHVMFVNKGFTEMTGYTLQMITEEFDGKYIGICEGQEDIDKVADAVRALQAGAKSCSLTYRIRHRDGHCIWVSEKISAYQNADGNPEALAVVWDITEPMTPLLLQQQIHL